MLSSVSTSLLDRATGARTVRMAADGAGTQVQFQAHREAEQPQLLQPEFPSGKIHSHFKTLLSGFRYGPLPQRRARKLNRLLCTRTSASATAGGRSSRNSPPCKRKARVLRCGTGLTSGGGRVKT